MSGDSDIWHSCEISQMKQSVWAEVLCTIHKNTMIKTFVGCFPIPIWPKCGIPVGGWGKEYCFLILILLLSGYSNHASSRHHTHNPWSWIAYPFTNQLLQGCNCFNWRVRVDWISCPSTRTAIKQNIWRQPQGTLLFSEITNSLQMWPKPCHRVNRRQKTQIKHI